MSVVTTLHAIVVRDLRRSLRQKSRLFGGLARSFMWLLLVGTGYNAIARVEGAASYQAFVYPGIVVMAALFGGDDGGAHRSRPVGGARRVRAGWRRAAVGAAVPRPDARRARGRGCRP